jgi:voltage-gated potassium channel
MTTRIRSIFADLIDDELRAALRCILALAFVVAFGTCGFTFIESDWGPWRALYFTLITITTVGYGDQGLSHSGQVFTAILLLVGISTATYSFTSFVQIAVNYQATWKRKMQGKINHLSDHFVICGFGRIGFTVAEQLRGAGYDVVVLDSHQEAIDLANEQHYLAITGNATDEQVLRQAGIERAQGIVCAINSDAENVFITLCAKEQNPSIFIAGRASTDSAARRMRLAGAKLVVSPYTTAGHTIADAILRPKLPDYLRASQASDVELAGFTVSQGSVFSGMTVEKARDRNPAIVFVALTRPGKGTSVRPNGGEQLLPGDALTVAGKRSDLGREPDGGRVGMLLV